MFGLGFVLRWLFKLFGLPAIVGLGAWWATHHYEQIGYQKAAAALAASNQSVITMLAANKAEHAVVEQLLSLAQKRKEAGAKALAVVAGREKAVERASDSLQASAALRRPENAPCVISETLAKTRGL